MSNMARRKGRMLSTGLQVAKPGRERKRTHRYKTVAYLELESLLETN